MSNNTEKKITYILGAGASFSKLDGNSFQGLPLVSNMKYHISNYCESLNNWLNASDNYMKYLHIKDLLAHKNYYNEHITELKSIIDIHDDFTTIDSYAQYLYTTDQKEKYQSLKKNFSIYFILIQIFDFSFMNNYENNWKLLKSDIKQFKTHNKYLKFLTTLIRSKRNQMKRFPENIKILSWNYDHQFEFAIDYFKLDKRDNMIYPSDLQAEKGDNIINVHLNGCAGVNYIGGNNVSIFKLLNKLKDENKLLEKGIFSIIKDYYDNAIKVDGSLRFAWEDNPFTNPNGNFAFTDQYFEHLENTNILVYIGYSFPEFNRKIDINILSKLDFKKIDKIYIQNPDKNIKSKFIDSFDLNILEDKIEIVEEENSLFIPSHFYNTSDLENSKHNYRVYKSLNRRS